MVKKSIRILFLLLIIGFSSIVRAAPPEYLTKVLVPETSFENPGTNWNAGDDSSIRINIGFNFPFKGTTYNRVWINSNGMLSFNSYNAEYINTGIPYNQEPQSIYPYWDDMNRNSGGTIRYETLGNVLNRHLVISWNNVPHYPNNGSYSFQVVLYEDGSIRFRYDAERDADGNSNGGATIGVQEDTNHYDVHSHNSAINQRRDVLYYRPADMQIIKTSCIIYDPVNITTNPKRIPGATIRYALQVSNSAAGIAKNVLVDDTLNSSFDYNTIKNLQIQNGLCDCTGVASASNNGANGTGNGVNPIKLDFGTVAGGSVANPTRECGYFEVNIK